MRIYFASPGNPLQAHMARGFPVLLSYAARQPWWLEYLPSFSRILIDSGAFSELNSGIQVDLSAYVEWTRKIHWADAWAGLDDISGDWRRSLKNYEAGGFPTIHDTDPPELLHDLIPLARERGGWLGVGLKPPRYGKERWVREMLDRVPDDLHVHGWACGLYTHVPRFDSVDSTNWWRDGHKVRQKLPWLTYGEALEIVVKRYQRWNRRVVGDEGQAEMFGAEHSTP